MISLIRGEIMTEKVLARVGDFEITEGALDTFMKYMDPQILPYFQNEEGKRRIVEELVNQEMLYRDALENKYHEDGEFKKLLEDTKVSMLKTYAIKKVFEGIEISEDEVKSYYEKNKSDFISKDSVGAKHILVDDLELANEIYKEIKGGGKFEDMAVKYSTCPSKERGGDLGSFSKGMMVPEFEAAAFNMNVGEISEPVKTQFGYHIINVYSKTDGQEESYESVHDEIIGTLRKQKEDENYKNKIAQLINKYKVEIF